MIEPFEALGEAWQDAFSWFVYPIRMPLLIVAWVVLIRLTALWVAPPLGRIIAWAGPKVAWLVGTVLLAPEYAYTMRLIRQGAGIPLALRLYGEGVESATDWMTASGRALGRHVRGFTAVSTKAALALVLLCVAVYNLNVLRHGSELDPPKAPATIWWKSFQTWLDDPQHPLWRDTLPRSGPHSPHHTPHSGRAPMGEFNGGRFDGEAAFRAGPASSSGAALPTGGATTGT
ncbi:hypothetical protein [Streptomyces echinatus]|uniref:hypothetical protein n=1 Tax=Streptomyces echinatus TaxID=67293 RepID=UPI0037AC982D